MITRRRLLQRGAMLAGALMFPGAAKLARPAPIPPHLLTFDTAPAWITCDGRPLSSAQFPELAATLGGKFGDAGPGTFRVPDLLGEARVAEPGPFPVMQFVIRTGRGNGETPIDRALGMESMLPAGVIASQGVIR